MEQNRSYRDIIHGRSWAICLLVLIVKFEMFITIFLLHELHSVSSKAQDALSYFQRQFLNINIDVPGDLALY